MKHIKRNHQLNYKSKLIIDSGEYIRDSLDLEEHSKILTTTGKILNFRPDLEIEYYRNGLDSIENLNLINDNQINYDAIFIEGNKASGNHFLKNYYAKFNINEPIDSNYLLGRNFIAKKLFFEKNDFIIIFKKNKKR